MRKGRKKYWRMFAVLLAAAIIAVSVPQTGFAVQAEETAEQGMAGEMQADAGASDSFSEEFEEKETDAAGGETGDADGETGAAGGETSDADGETGAADKETGETGVETDDADGENSVTDEKDTVSGEGTDAAEEETGTAGETSGGSGMEEEPSDDAEPETGGESGTQSVSDNTMAADVQTYASVVESGEMRNSNYTWSLDARGKLTVTGTGDLPRGSALISNVPFGEGEEIKAIELHSKGMTNAEMLFYSFPNVTSIDIDDFDTGSITNMSYMFYNLEKLTKVDLSGCDLGNVTDMSHMFEHCDKLNDVTFGRCDTGSVTDMSYMFSQCYKLRQLDLSALDTGSVTDMTGMFQECKSLTGLDLKSFDTRHVTTMQDMFRECKTLAALDVSSFRTGSVMNMAGMFFDCCSLKKLDISNFDLSGIRYDSNNGDCLYFMNCTGLTELNLGGVCLQGGHSVSLTDSRNLTTLYTPYTTDEKWLKKDAMIVHWCPAFYDADGNRYDGYIPWLDHSIRLTKTKSQAGTAKSSITVQMNKSAYTCGETVGPQDFTVKRYGRDGKVTVLSETDYRTNIDGIDMSVPGRKKLVVFYDSGGDTLAATAELTVSCILTEENTKADLEGNGSYVFDGKEQMPLQSVTFRNGEEEVPLKEGTDYKVYYRNNLNTGDAQAVIRGIGVYSGALTIPFRIEKADIPDETLTFYATECQKRMINHNVPVREAFKDYGEKKGYEIEEIVEDDTISKDVVLKDADTKPRISSGILYCSTDAGTGGDFATIRIKVTYEANYNDATLYVKIILRRAKMATIHNVMMEDSQYDGRRAAYQVMPGYWGWGVYALIDGQPRRIDDEYIVCEYRGTLADGTPYDSVDGPKDAGEYELTMTIRIEEEVEGSETYPFKITKAPLEIRAEDMALSVGESAPESYGYQTTGLVDGEQLEPQFTVTDTEGNTVERIDTEKPGSYYIVPAVSESEGVGKNYNVSCQKGLLTVAQERIIYHRVTFDSMGHGGGVPVSRVPAGGLLEEPEQPEADGYRFAGWYRERTFAKGTAWNFAKDTVQGNMTLYACWLTDAASENQAGMGLCIQDIRPQAYTGNAVKPTVVVYDSDGMALTVGRHYTVSYKNNTDASALMADGTVRAGGIKCTEMEGKKEVTVVNRGFNASLPYVVIKGKGDYAGAVYQNFVIERADIAKADGSPAPGFTLKYTDQTVKSPSKNLNVFGSLKYKRAMNLGTDYMVTLRAQSNVNADGNEEESCSDQWWRGTEQNDRNQYVLPTIPKGFYGVFTMTVEGVGNYRGTIRKNICVSENASGLMKNAVITLGKSQKTIQNVTAAALSDGITLTPGYYDKEKKEYYAIQDGQKVKQGNGDTVFTVSLKKDGKAVYLIYEDGNSGQSPYFISYQANKEVGTAVMTVTGNPDMGYYGSKSVTFKIAGMPFSARTVDVKVYDQEKNPNRSDFQGKMPYTGWAVTQNGVTLTTKVTKTNPTEQKLVYGTHYFISYKNNVGKGTAVMVFTANPASGFSGSFQKTFKIEAAKLAETVEPGKDGVSVERSGGSIQSMTITAPVPYEQGGAKPSAKEKLALRRADNGILLQEGTDYTVSYKNHAAVTRGDTRNKPVMTVRGKGNYQGSLTVNFTIGQASVDELIADGRITFTPVKFNPSGKDGKQYKPAVKITDVNGKALKAGKDYHVAYKRNTQKELAGFFHADGQTQDAAFPAAAVITVPENGSYKMSGKQAEIEVPLEGCIYGEKLENNKNIYVVVDGAVYTGAQCRPEVKVYYGAKDDIGKAKKSGETDADMLVYRYHLRQLAQDRDYALVYGANVAAGKNKGSVTVTGIGRKYGGSVNIKFYIVQKSVYSR